MSPGSLQWHCCAFQLGCCVTADLTQDQSFGVVLVSPLLGDKAKAWSVFGCRAQQHMEQTLDGLCVRVAHNHTFDGLWLRMANDFNRLQGKSAIRVSLHVIQLPCVGWCYAVSCRAFLC